jgi:hypothetical protein
MSLYIQIMLFINGPSKCMYRKVRPILKDHRVTNWSAKDDPRLHRNRDP